MDIFKDFLARTGRGIGKVIQANLISSLITFIISLIGLSLAGVTNPLVFALLIGLTEWIPFVGGWMVLLPWSVISFLSANTKAGIILAIIFLIIVAADEVIEPLIIGKTLGLKPRYTILITLASMILLTPVVGAIVGNLASIIISVIIDMRKGYIPSGGESTCDGN